MGIKIILFILLLILPTNSYAKPTLYDWVVGGTLKTLVKVYIKTSNLPKLKTKFTKKIAKMKEDKFHKNYMKFYTVYKDLPAEIKGRFSFNERTTKSDVIHAIDVVNKKDLIAIISKIPSEFICKQTKNYVAPLSDQSSPQGRGGGVFLFNSLIQKIQA